MAFITDEKELYDLYSQARDESEQWRRDYHEYERLADNDLIEDLDETLPEVNDGSLAASLFKLPKRVVNSKLTGRAIADADDAWITELANIVWEKKIIPNANSQAPFIRKWKDAVRKAAIYGSVPLITLFVERGNYIGSDFIVAQPQDVCLEPGKVSDYDSDVVFWDVYYSKSQVRALIERAKEENKEAKENPEDGYNKWNIPALKKILASKQTEERPQNEDHRDRDDAGTKQAGYKFCIAFQRGVGAPFYMYHKGTKETVREWSNPDPTGDIPVHFLYCYQDFVNPYGTGIVKLAGGTQNVLDYMRQADVLATQLGFRPPISIGGDMESADLDSIVYAQDAQWYVGNATVKRELISNEIYGQLPARMGMYKTSLNQLIPTGDTSIAAESGDPNYSKTPAGVAFQKASLSIDDEDFKDNLYITYEAKAKSMINTMFANMQGSDLMKLSDEERDILMKAGLEFPVDENGDPTNELEVLWDNARSTFDFEIDAEQDKASDEEKRLEGQLKVLEIVRSDPNLEMDLQASGKRLNKGELLSEIISLTSDNDKIIEDISPEDMEAMQEEQLMAQQGMETEPLIETTAGQPDSSLQGLPLAEEPQGGAPMEQPMIPEEAMPVQNEMEDELAITMEEYNVDEDTAAAIQEARAQGFEEVEIVDSLVRTGVLAPQEEVLNV